MTEERFQLWTS